MTVIIQSLWHYSKHLISHRFDFVFIFPFDRYDVKTVRPDVHWHYYKEHWHISFQNNSIMECHHIRCNKIKLWLMCFCFQRQNIFEDTFTDTERKTHKHTHLQNMPEIVIANLPTLCFLYFVISEHQGLCRKPVTRLVLVERSKYMGYPSPAIDSGQRLSFFEKWRERRLLILKKIGGQNRFLFFKIKRGLILINLKILKNKILFSKRPVRSSKNRSIYKIKLFQGVLIATGANQK